MVASKGVSERVQEEAVLPAGQYTVVHVRGCVGGYIYMHRYTARPVGRVGFCEWETHRSPKPIKSRFLQLRFQDEARHLDGRGIHNQTQHHSHRPRTTVHERRRTHERKATHPYTPRPAPQAPATKSTLRQDGLAVIQRALSVSRRPFTTAALQLPLPS